MSNVAETSSSYRPEILRSRQRGLMRVLASALIVVGLLQWATIVGLLPIGPDQFSEASASWQWATINLATAYLVAAVGLWLLTPWGVVIWVYAVGCEVAMSTVFVGTFGFRVLPLLVQFALLGTYLASAIALRRAEATDQLASRGDRIASRPDASIATRDNPRSAGERIVQRPKPRRSNAAGPVEQASAVGRAG